MWNCWDFYYMWCKGLARGLWDIRPRYVTAESDVFLSISNPAMISCLMAISALTGVH